MSDPIEEAKRRETQEAMAILVREVTKHLPPDWGYFFFVSPFKKGGRANYASNMERVGAMNTMKEFILNNNGTEEEWMKHIEQPFNLSWRVILIKTLEYKGGPFDGETTTLEWADGAWAVTGDKPGEDKRKHLYTLRTDGARGEWLQYEGEAE